MIRFRIRPTFTLLVALTAFALVAAPAAAQRIEPLDYSGQGHTVHGDWRAAVSVSRSRWRASQPLVIDVDLVVTPDHLASLASAGVKADKLCVLLTAERTFDADGWMRLPSDERMSTLLTPTGLAIEGGVQGAVTNRYGYPFKSPLDLFQSRAAADLIDRGDGTRTLHFSFTTSLPADLPPGLYRLRTDFGVMAGSRTYNLNGYGFATRPFSDQAGTSTYFYSPIVPASGVHASGREVDANQIAPRFPWLLLASYNSNGYRGVVADEDRARFATSDRSLIPDEVILPMYDDAGKRLSYSLEPQFPADTIDALQNIEWDWTAGELSVQVAGPDGRVTNLGTAAFTKKTGNGPTTGYAPFTTWRPEAYGAYTVTAIGWIRDVSGRRYEGGGTYQFWIAKRMTLATATFQGMPYPVGSNYGRDIQFNPPVPADVQVTASLFVNSDRLDVRSISYSGKATTGGLFGAAQGMKPLPLNAPGEYAAHVRATYTDADGHLWVCSMRHAGVVYSEDSGVIARGKKLSINGKYVDRGETKFEGYVDAAGENHLAHITFPYLAGDVLLIAAEGQGANKIEPVLTYQLQGDTSPWDSRLNGVGTTNLRITTSNGYSPHLYPEYITDYEYYYGAAPRPGFMGRFIVGESTIRAPYWPVSPNSFGGQIGASANGDAPGDIYRLIGGVVLKRRGRTPMYAGYISSAFLLPKGTNNNRVVAAGSEDLNGPLGERARFFLVGLRPGTSYEVGASFRAAVQIDPLLPVALRFTLTYPDGRQKVAEGTGDKYGSFVGSTWALDVPGVYRYQLRGNWNGYEGRMPGLPESGGEFYVYSKNRPAGTAGLRIDGAAQRTFSASGTLTITGSSTAPAVRYSVLTPGAVIDIGELPVRGGKFQYVFDPAAVHAKVPLYDIVSVTSGRPQIGRVVHLTFFSEERTGGGTFFDFARVILRGTTMIAARAVAPASLVSLGGPWQVAAIEPADVRLWDTYVDRLARSGEVHVVARRPDTIVPGRTHERLQQFHRGVPIFGGDLTRQTMGGVTVSIFGSIHSGVNVSTAPAVSSDEAQAIVARRGLHPVAASLTILPIDGGGYALTWRVDAREGLRVHDVFVHASTGEVLLDIGRSRSWVERAEEMEGARLGSDAAGAARALTSAIQDFRRVSDAAGLINFVGVLRQADGAREIVFSGAPRHGRLLVLEEDPSPGREVVAHRLVHALIDSSARLIYRGEAGAIAEGSANALAPGAAGRGPALSLAGDERAVLVERAHYLAVTQGAAAGAAEKIDAAWLRALVCLLPSNPSLAQARAATIQAARDLYEGRSAAEQALQAGWAAAGIR